MNSLVEIKEKYQVPENLQSCHTAIVDGYIVEGHVPAEEVERLLTEQPEIIGIAVIGMPPGSPGMEDDRGTVGTFDVVAFDKTGITEVYASYPK